LAAIFPAPSSETNPGSSTDEGYNQGMEKHQTKHAPYRPFKEGRQQLKLNRTWRPRISQELVDHRRL
jgi:hypothetical protein